MKLQNIGRGRLSFGALFGSTGVTRYFGRGAIGHRSIGAPFKALGGGVTPPIITPATSGIVPPGGRHVADVSGAFGNGGGFGVGALGGFGEVGGVGKGGGGSAAS